MERIDRFAYIGHRDPDQDSQIIKIHIEPGDREFELLPLPDWYIEELQLRNIGRGFDWGYVGKKPRNLAVAILWDVTNDAYMVKQYYSDFTFLVIAELDDDWVLSKAAVIEWIEDREPDMVIDLN